MFSRLKLISFTNRYLFIFQNSNIGVILIEGCLIAARIAANNHHYSIVHYFLQLTKPINLSLTDEEEVIKH